MARRGKDSQNLEKPEAQAPLDKGRRVESRKSKVSQKDFRLSTFDLENGRSCTTPESRCRGFGRGADYRVLDCAVWRPAAAGRRDVHDLRALSPGAGHYG